MAQDIYVYWKKEAPSMIELEEALKGYLGEEAEVEWRGDQSRWYATFKGKPSNPFSPPYRDDTRWFEVYADAKGIDIITRMQDEFTNVVARGFAKAIARRWSARLEDG